MSVAFDSDVTLTVEIGFDSNPVMHHKLSLMFLLCQVMK